MITIFSTTRPFVGQVALNQRNAIESWKQAGLHVILFGSDEEMGVMRDNTLPRTEGGTYKASDLFTRAQDLSSDSVLCYCNADMVLMSDFVNAVRNMAGTLSKFVAVGQRIDLDISKPLDFGNGWEGNLRSLAMLQGKPHDVCGMDYIVFSKPLALNWEPVLVGRPAWDVWLLRHVLDAGIPLVDMTHDVMAVHCNHGPRQYENGPNANPLAIAEARHNQMLTAHVRHAYITHATHTLVDGNVARKYGQVEEKVVVEHAKPLGRDTVHFTRDSKRGARIQRGR